MTFSKRLPTGLVPNRLSDLLSRLRQTGGSYIDLTESNPTRAGFEYPAELLRGLAHPRGLQYAPQPLGLEEARVAVSHDFLRRRLDVPPDAVTLTASTSEAYSMIFKLLCDPGDEVLVPRPSYPLLEHLTRLDAVRAQPYDLDYHGRWAVDISSLERGFSDRTRAVLLVNPNNPTGSFLTDSELDRIAILCGAHGAAVISDEVFADYELTTGAGEAAGGLLRRRDVLGFTLGGLSKSVGLPQLKLAWIALSGRAEDLDAARTRLEIVSDSYLSVATPVQAALPEILSLGASVRAQIQQRIRANDACLRARAAEAPSCDLLHADGGWYRVLQVPSLMPEEDLVVNLLTEDGVLVHPGYFYDFARESFLIVSLLAPEAEFASGLRRVLSRIEQAQAVG